MRRLLLLAVVLALASCATDRRLVANASAAYQYSETRYEWACVQVVGPSDCQQRRDELREAKRETVLCNDVQRTGKLPKVARKRLKSIIKDLPR